MRVRWYSLIPAAMSLAAFLAIWRWPGFALTEPWHIYDSRGLYLFSTIAQSIAALVGVLVSALLVATQLVWSYSARATVDVLTPAARTYLVLLATTIFWSVWAISDPTEFAARVAVTLTALALVWLLPFVRQVMVDLSLDSVLVRLTGQVAREFASKNVFWPEAELALQKVFDLLSKATKDENFEAVENTAGHLCAAAHHVPSNHAFTVLRQLGEWACEDRWPPRVTAIVSNQIMRYAATLIRGEQTPSQWSELCLTVLGAMLRTAVKTQQARCRAVLSPLMNGDWSMRIIKGPLLPAVLKKLDAWIWELRRYPEMHEVREELAETAIRMAVEVLGRTDVVEDGGVKGAVIGLLAAALNVNIAVDDNTAVRLRQAVAGLRSEAPERVLNEQIEEIVQRLGGRGDVGDSSPRD